MVLGDTPIGREGGGQDEKLINSNFLRRPLSTFLHSLQKCSSIPRKRQLDLTYWLGNLVPQGTFGSCR